MDTNYNVTQINKNPYKYILSTQLSIKEAEGDLESYDLEVLDEIKAQIGSGRVTRRMLDVPAMDLVQGPQEGT